MPIRYYPITKIKPNKKTTGREFLLNGLPYKGKYYETYDGRYFSGPNPVIGPNEELTAIKYYPNAAFLNSEYFDVRVAHQAAKQTNSNSNIFRNIDLKDSPTSFFPIPLDSDYLAGKFFRYFAKRINIQGYVIEISKYEYDAINAGSVPYDISMWQTIELFWKLTGPLKTKRLSQYDIRAGIEDTNKRLVENAEKTFVGIKAFIGEEYTKFARVTE